MTDSDIQTVSILIVVAVALSGWVFDIHTYEVASLMLLVLIVVLSLDDE